MSGAEPFVYGQGFMEPTAVGFESECDLAGLAGIFVIERDLNPAEGPTYGIFFFAEGAC